MKPMRTKQVPELHLATTASFALIWKSIWFPHHMSKLIFGDMLAQPLNAEFRLAKCGKGGGPGSHLCLMTGSWRRDDKKSSFSRRVGGCVTRRKPPERLRTSPQRPQPRVLRAFLHLPSFLSISRLVGSVTLRLVVAGVWWVSHYFSLTCPEMERVMSHH